MYLRRMLFEHGWIYAGVKVVSKVTMLLLLAVLQACLWVHLVVLPGEGVAVVQEEAAAMHVHRCAKPQVVGLITHRALVLPQRRHAHRCMNLQRPAIDSSST